MTTQNTKAAYRPLAAVLAFAFMTAFWVPTLATPGHDHAAADRTVLVVAASGAYAPVLM